MSPPNSLPDPSVDSNSIAPLVRGLPSSVTFPSAMCVDGPQPLASPMHIAITIVNRRLASLHTSAPFLEQCAFDWFAAVRRAKAQPNFRVDAVANDPDAAV